MIKPKKAVCGVKSGKSRPVSKNNKVGSKECSN